MTNWFLHIASKLYGLGVELRNLLYTQGVLRSRPAALPTICVGNLAVGGTGKTPHVEYLVRLLTEQGLRIAVLSRGYKRRTRGFVLAGEHATPATIGDEAMQIHLKFPSLIVAVCEDRLRGVELLKQRFPDLDVVLLDDAYQHRRLKAGFNLLLTQADRLYVEDQLLPAGRLREPALESIRAQMVVVTKCPATLTPIDRRVVHNKLSLPEYMPLVFTGIRYAPIRPLFSEYDTGQPLTLTDKHVLLLTGIAQPHYLLEHVQSLAARVTHLSFPDHHAFTPNDMLRIYRTIAESGCQLVLTTEKDAVRLRQCEHMITDWKSLICVCPIQVTFMNDDRETFDKTILRYVRESAKDR